MSSTFFRIRQYLIAIIVIFSIYYLSQAFIFTAKDGAGREETINAANEHSIDLNYVNLTGIDVIIVGEDDGRSSNSTRKTISKEVSTGSICNIPRLEINSTEVKDFFTSPKPLDCHLKNKKNWVFINDKGEFEYIEEHKSAECRIYYFERQTDSDNSMSERQSVVAGQKMKSDFGVIKCKDIGSKWAGLLMSVAEKADVRERQTAKTRPSDASGMDVFFLGFDSLSQMSFRRKLPKTVKFLEEELGSVVLNGYNIVGDGTPQAFIPILTAGTEEELPLTRKRFGAAHYVDDVYPFIWKNFSDAGYVTAYGEDAFNIGTFTYRLKGFRSQPTDHYTRTFFKEAEKNSNWHCLGSDPLYESWFRYAKEFMSVYSSLPRFLMMHQSLFSHDDINLVQVQDDYLAEFLRKMLAEGFFDNALVVIMADHGHRFAKLRETHQGQLEERLPFFSLALPKKFKESDVGKVAHSNLVNNKNRLSSPFDIHATLMDIIHLPSKQTLQKPQEGTKRSLSLFRPLPEDRNCDQAGIAAHWCTCLNWQDAMTTIEDKKRSQKMAQILVNTINRQLRNVKDLCATLRLKEIKSAKKLLPNVDLLKYKNVKDADGFVADLSGNTKAAFAHYQLQIVTTPGNAIYEVTMFDDYVKNSVRVDLASLSHVNKFGDDPHCIIDKNYFLATYCVCHDRV